MHLQSTRILILAALSLVATIDTNASDNPVQTRGDMLEVQENNIRAIVHFGKMQVGSTQNFKISIENSLGYQLRLGEAQSSCGCVKVAVTNSTVGKGEDLELEVTFETPPSPKSTTYSQHIQFGDNSNGKQLLQITLSCELTGVLALPHPRHFVSVQEAENKQKTFSMPLVISDPVRPENLEVSTSESMSDIVATVKTTKDKGTELEFVILPGTVDDEGIGGAVFVIDSVTKQKVSAYVNIVKEAPVKIVPHAIRWVPDGEGFVKATAMLIFSERSAGDENVAMVDASIGDSPVDLSIKPIGNHAVRVSLKFPTEKIADIVETEQKIDWLIRSERGVDKVHSDFVFLNDR